MSRASVPWPRCAVWAVWMALVFAPGASRADPPANTPDEIICRAQSGVGFSYYWGGGCWCANGCSPDFSCSPGSCSGNCPSCTHSGTYGADCSGFVTKVWQVPNAIAVNSCGHGPYVAASYTSSSSYWSVIDRSQAERGDAMASSGHVLIFESGDPWGYMWMYEASGCSVGIVHNNRSLSNDYSAARRINVSSGECSPGEVDTQGCGNCGTQSRTCGNDSMWGGWGSCTGQGPCAAGSSESQACCEYGGGYDVCGSQVRTCGGDCEWGGWGACGGPDPNGGNTYCDTGECGVCAEGRERCVSGCVMCVREVDPTEEICDHLDNDCDCDTDEGLPLFIFYTDADGDGYGDHDTPEVDCGLFPGFVDNDLDCDDADASQYPGAAEVCNYEDDDCDDEIDEGVRPTYYWDGDLDDWGNVTITTTEYCSLDDANADVVDGQWVDQAGDCDDENWELHPDAGEICDGIDNNCNGTVDEGACSGADPLDGDGDGFAEGDGDCDDADWTVYPGAPEICDGVDNDCSAATEVDEGTDCFDADGDGFSPLDGDCDDSDPTCFPGAQEILGDTRDNDCDDLVDEDPAVDRDGDGYAEVDGDCDEEDAAIHPGALEVPRDLLDNDCDGDVDEPVPPGTNCAAVSRNPPGFAGGWVLAWFLVVRRYGRRGRRSNS